MHRESIVAIHQPNYLPWLGFFDKVNKADIFILLDNVQFSKGSWSNRVKVKNREDELWLSVPIKKKGRSTQLICETEILYAANWVKKHLGTLEQGYRGARHFDEVFPAIAQVLSGEFQFLSDLNSALIREILQLLGIRTELISAKSLGASSRSTELLVEMTREVGGGAYLSGDGADGYLEPDLFGEREISLLFQQFEHPVYEQRSGDFIAGLSIFDILCCCGVEKTQKILHSQKDGWLESLKF